jgi:acylglycerol lipase
LRISTGLSLLEGMIELQKRAEEIDIRAYSLVYALMIAIRLVHGTSDRATSPHATLKLYERLPNEDKEIELYEGYEHGECDVDVSVMLNANVSDDEGWN